MLHPDNKKLYKASLKDDEFMDNVVSREPTDKPKWWWDDRRKALFSIMYYGYLIGKNRVGEVL